jgi:hypothetical protein
MRAALSTLTGTGVLTVLAALGWPAILLTVAVIVVFAVGVRWVLADPSRTERLAILIHAFRRPSPAPDRAVGQASRSDSGRPRRPPGQRV